MSGRVVASIRIALILAALPPLFRPQAWSRPQFVFPPVSRIDSRPFREDEFLPRTQAAIVHGATMAELPNGNLIAAWYGGSDETRSDVRIYSSIKDARTGRWSPLAILEDHRGAERAIHSAVKSVGNPVLFGDARGLSLFYVAIPFGGWSMGTICLKTSPDGVRWSPAHRLTASPLSNLGVLVRGRPWAYTDDTIALPVYYQLGRKGSGILRVDREGVVRDESRLEDGRPLIQPWIIPITPDRALALFRWSSPMPGCVRIAATTPGGSRWSPVFGTPLVHRDSAVAGERLRDGSLLVAYNNTAWDRRDLSIARSADAGWSWSRPQPLERDITPDWIVRREYSYPYFYRARDGRIHLLYSWQRTQIRHLTFNDAWVLSQPLLAPRQ